MLRLCRQIHFSTKIVYGKGNSSISDVNEAEFTYATPFDLFYSFLIRMYLQLKCIQIHPC
jgi:hypothetical protein